MINLLYTLPLLLHKDACMFWSWICSFNFKTDKVLGKDFVRCDMNDITISHAMCIEKNTVYYVISLRERRNGFRKPLCEINSIKTDNIDGYIMKSL